MNLYQLDPVTIAKGASANLVYVFENKDKSAVDYSTHEGYFILSQYGFEDENVFSTSMNIEGNDTFVAILDTADTEDIEEGTYTIKIVLVDENGNQYKYARGILNVLKDTSEIEVTV